MLFLYQYKLYQNVENVMGDNVYVYQDGKNVTVYQDGKNVAANNITILHT